MKFFRTLAPKETIAARDYPASGFIPYKMHINDRTLLTNDNRLIQVVKVGGFSFETADDEDLDNRKSLRNQLFKGLAGSNCSFYFHILRRKEQIYPHDYASIDMPDGFALYLDEKWVEKHRKHDAYVNELYVSVIKPIPGMGGNSALDKILQATDQESYNSKIREAIEEVDEASNRVLTSLRDYSAEQLSVERVGDVLYSEIGEFLTKLINAGESTKIPLSSNEISRQLNTNRIYFGKRSLEIKCNGGVSKFAGVVSVKEYGPKTWASMMDSFLKLPHEFIVSQSFEFSNRQAAIGQMQLQQNRMIQAGDKAVSQIEEINIALDMAMSGEIGFGKHHLTITCFADTPKELENVLSVMAVELTNTGGIGVREKATWSPHIGHNFLVISTSLLENLLLTR
jgi:type IV secretion system protein VirB4